MPLSFQIEDVDTFARDGAGIFPRHFEELSLHKDKIKFGLDFDLYRKVEKEGLTHILTVRDDGKMIGYIVSLVVKHHPHNMDSGLYSTTDMFYVLPEYRATGRGIGVKMLIENERRLRELGVTRMSISTKLKDAHLEFFIKMGYEPTDLVFHKMLI